MSDVIPYFPIVYTAAQFRPAPHALLTTPLIPVSVYLANFSCHIVTFAIRVPNTAGDVISQSIVWTFGQPLINASCAMQLCPIAQHVSHQ